MTIYELFDSIPPEQINDVDGATAWKQLDFTCAEGRVETVAYVHPKVAPALRHCLWKFMDALEGLKRARRSMACQCSCVAMCGHDHDCEIAVVDRLIADLETVNNES